MVHEGLRVCEECRGGGGGGGGGATQRLPQGVWKGDGGGRAGDEGEDEAVKHTMIHQLWEFS